MGNTARGTDVLISGGYTARFVEDMRQNQMEMRERAGQVSTGARILHSADDAAGLAMATKVRVTIRSREVAVRNTEAGMAMVNLADQALSTTAQVLTRMRELAVQSSSETLGDTERVFIATEFDELLDEIDRNARSTLYNDKPVITPPGVDVGLLIDTSGSMGGEKNQVQNALQDFIDQFVDARYNIEVGIAAYADTKDSIDNVDLRAQIGSTNLNQVINDLTLGLGPVDPYAAMTETTGITSIVGDVEDDKFTFRESSVRMLIVVSDAKRSADYIGMTETEVADALVKEEVQVHTITPTAVQFDYDEIATATGGGNYDIGDSSGSNIATALEDIANTVIDALDNDSAFTLHVGPDATDRLDTPLPVDASVLGLGLADVDVSTVSNARSAITELDGAIDAVSGMRAQIGATQRRLSHTLQRHAEALEAEYATTSRIEDQDHAIAATELTAVQVRQQGLIAAAQVTRQMDRQFAETLLP